MPVWTELYVELFPLLCSLLLLSAWQWGSTTELKIALIYVLATDLQKSVQGLRAPMFTQFELGVATIDFAVLTTLTVIAVREPRKWILCSAALQMLVTSGHLAKILDSKINALSYAILMGSGGYPIILLLAGSIAHTGLLRRRAAQSS